MLLTFGTVTALHISSGTRLFAFLAYVAFRLVISVAQLEPATIQRTLTILSAITARNLPLLIAVFCHVPFLTTVAAFASSTRRAVPSEVTGCARYQHDLTTTTKGRTYSLRIAYILPLPRTSAQGSRRRGVLTAYSSGRQLDRRVLACSLSHGDRPPGRGRT